MGAVRLASAQDVARLPAIERRAAERFRAIGFDHVADGPTMPLDALHAARERGDLFVVGEPVAIGFAVLDAAGDDAYLDELSVDVDHAGRGLGAQLLEHVCAVARRRGHRTIALSTFADVPWNARYYARRGFSIVPPEELTAALRSRVRDDVERGLAVHRRVVMRRVL